MRLPDFIITKAHGLHIFTYLGEPAMDYWEENWENHPAVGNAGVVFEEALAAEIEVDLRKHFRVEIFTFVQ